jgi:hypothetical protein
VSAANNDSADAFQPGQLGTRHLLGVMTVAAIILGISAARLRTLTALEIGLVAAHWAIVLSIAGVTFYVTSRRRRRDQTAAGGLLLCALCRPMSERRRATIKWVLTALVIIDGIFISLVVYPGLTPPKLSQRGLTTAGIMAAALRGAMPQIALWEGGLWGWCLSHWLTNVYRVEFREHGILMYSGFCPYRGKG